MKFRKFKISDIRQVANIKYSVYKQFNKKEYFQKGAVSNYLSLTDPQKSDRELLEEFRPTNSIFYVAEENNNIIGFIQGRKNKLTNLFVIGDKHKKGIGKKLVDLFEKEAKNQESKEIKIHSSIYAIPFYQKKGYKKTTGIRNYHGLKTQPMKKKLD